MFFRAQAGWNSRLHLLQPRQYRQPACPVQVDGEEPFIVGPVVLAAKPYHLLGITAAAVDGEDGRDRLRPKKEMRKNRRIGAYDADRELSVRAFILLS
jgi:hypothetical protein